ncbi:hypothetical protein BP5796_02743 [Coleophoma crateriformis]|uniref:Uncharacterized protein n=1 Tax=Coleophoma crateriformis TaxID=565419 RepID=A0A3D8T0P8_9HELO|nr:hypothetical protein BP5796_02743 [Coleophoma crateriformis]
MSLRAVELDPLHLFSLHEKLKLSVQAAADIDCPCGNLLDLSPDEFLVALTSMTMWVARGSRCCIEICLTVDGEGLLGHYRSTVMESLCNCIREAPFWSQLSLSVSLRESCMDEVPEANEPGIMLNVDHKLHLSELDGDFGSSLGFLSEFRPPEGILCPKFAKLRMNLAFETMTVSRTTKRAKLTGVASETVSRSPQEHIAKSRTDDTALDHLEEVVKRIHHNLSSSILTSFGEPRTTNLSFMDLDWSPKDAVSEDNIDDENTEKVFPQCELGNSLFEQYSSIPAAYSQSSGSAKCDLAEADVSITTLNISKACQLAETAMRLVISGFRRGQRHMADISIQHPWPSTALCAISPSLWCPGFKLASGSQEKCMDQNAQFLPSISQAICVSWTQNAQSPSLRQKLLQLADSVPSHSNENNSGLGATGATDRLTSVVQSRLWTMMQRKLYDPSAARHLRLSVHRDWQAEPEAADFEDLLQNDTASQDADTCLEDEEDSASSVFHDVLADFEYDEEVDLLAAQEEKERQSTERETDIMLVDEQNMDHEDDENDILFGQINWHVRDTGIGAPDKIGDCMLLSGGSRDSMYVNVSSSLTNEDTYGATMASSSSMAEGIAEDETLASEQCSEDNLWSDEGEMLL